MRKKLTLLFFAAQLGCSAQLGSESDVDPNPNFALPAQSSFTCKTFKQPLTQPLNNTAPIGESLSQYVVDQLRRLDPSPELSEISGCEVETYDLSGTLYEYVQCGSYSTVRTSSGFAREAEADVVFRHTVGLEQISKELLDSDLDGQLDSVSYFSYEKNFSDIAGCTYENVSSVTKYDNYVATLTVLGGTVTCTPDENGEAVDQRWACEDPVSGSNTDETDKTETE